MNIYVANLSFDVQDEDMKNLFTPYGDVSSAKIIVDKVTGRSRGFGFVEMDNDAAGRKAIAELNGTMMRTGPLRSMRQSPKRKNHMAAIAEALPAAVMAVITITMQTAIIRTDISCLCR